MQEKKLHMCRDQGSVDLGDDLVQSTAQEGSHGHRTQCLPPLATEATLKPAYGRVSPTPVSVAKEVQCIGVLHR